MKTSASIALKTGVLAFLLAGSAAAQLGSFTGTTCGLPSAVNDLSSGVYQLLGGDVTYPIRQFYGTATLTAGSSGPSLVLTVCKDPPSPTADCVAVEATPGTPTSVGYVPTRPNTSTNIWIVVDAQQAPGSETQICGSYTLTISGPLG